MSTFHGKIEEIPEISVDRFDRDNVNSIAFFLSHCHSDHMVGLKSYYFHEKLIKENKYLYLSQISAVILRALMPHISSQIKELPLEQITSINIANKYIAVTCIPAGHCPGSVMFLFEIGNKRILYTGDYRISASDITKFKCFYDPFNNVKILNKLYLDTTFFMQSYSVFPKRQDSLTELCRIIKGWILQDPENCIKLDLRAKYGYEYVFKEIYNIFQMPVHVDKEKYDFYSLIPELDKCVTTEGNATQIHNCFFGQKDICDISNNDKLRIIKLSAFRWENNINFENGLCEVDEKGIYYVCYSTHASYNEGVALINFLKPKDIHICVERPNDPVADIHIKKLVDEHLKEITGVDQKVDGPKLFEIVNVNSKYVKQESSEGLNGSPPKKILKQDNILDSPPR